MAFLTVAAIAYASGTGVTLAFPSPRRYGRGMEGGAQEIESSAGLRQVLLDMHTILRRFALARGCADSEADDLLQDLFIKVSELRGGPIANPRAYLFQMTSNLILDRRRVEMRQVRREDGWARSTFGHDLVDDPQPTPETTALDRDLLTRVEHALGAMPQRTAEILKLYRVDGLAQKAIAARFDLSLSAVEKHLQRAYKDLDALKLSWARQDQEKVAIDG
ncbi:RNA polymerase sigma factor [Tsuneonella sp. YG55]|uniref:RNA polymerase sigma factor n=1 Tax=Tsuneonella litorea TaxID=2976475 RepID=A0A9X2W413_9SPHN|nr:RNA polymerase sigma factor [Tsuneonella litorea]MCT2560189.1 RNA polymerase sigma factor [Tsuneonella litorea]